MLGNVIGASSYTMQYVHVPILITLGISIALAMKQPEILPDTDLGMWCREGRTPNVGVFSATNDLIRQITALLCDRLQWSISNHEDDR
jgi:hypothetical protein